MQLQAMTGVLVIGRGSVRPRAYDQAFARGESCKGDFALLLDDGSPADITGCALSLEVAGLFGRELDIVSGPAGTADYEVATGDTFGGQEGRYDAEVIFIDNPGRYGEPGGRYQVIKPSNWHLGPTYSENPPVVSLAPSQRILAQGPAGPPGVVGLVTDIQPVGIAADAGSTGRWTDSGHVHPWGDVFQVQTDDDTPSESVIDLPQVAGVYHYEFSVGARLHDGSSVSHAWSARLAVQRTASAAVLLVGALNTSGLNEWSDPAAQDWEIGALISGGGVVFVVRGGLGQLIDWEIRYARKM